MSTATVSQVGFYKDYLMSRRKFVPQDFGIEMGREDFDDLMVETFNQHTGGGITIDEMLLRPRQAMRFCDDVRTQHHWHDLPDDIILRVIMQRRKNPGG